MEEELSTGPGRVPGQTVHLHTKLSSPSRRKRDLEDITREKLMEKQRKAKELRERLTREKLERMHDLTAKGEEARVYKEQLIRGRHVMQAEKIQRAERKRSQVGR